MFYHGIDFSRLSIKMVEALKKLRLFGDFRKKVKTTSAAL